MMSYIYIALESSAMGKAEVANATVRKYELRNFFKRKLAEGESIAHYQVVRVKQDQPNSVTYIDVYDFMDIDLGETE